MSRSSLTPPPYPAAGGAAPPWRRPTRGGSLHADRPRHGRPVAARVDRDEAQPDAEALARQGALGLLAELQRDLPRRVRRQRAGLARQDEVAGLGDLRGARRAEQLGLERHRLVGLEREAVALGEERLALDP